MTSNFLTKNDIPSHIMKTILNYMPHLLFLTQICVVYNTFVCWFDPKLWWSIAKINCLYYSIRVDLYSHQIIFINTETVQTDLFSISSVITGIEW